jgi:hypothetical protein
MKVEPVGSWGKQQWYPAKVGTGPSTVIIVRARKFRQFMRRRIEGACREMKSLSNLGAFTPADADDIHDVLVLLDRITRDLSQQNWGK